MKNINKYLRFTTNNTNRHEQQGNMITRVRGLFSLLCAAVVLFTACFGFDERPDEFGADFVAVESIYGVTERSQPFVRTLLSGTVMPEDATEKKIEWSITNQGGTNSTLDENVLTADAEGTVTVTATIKNGLADGVDFTENFHIVISLVSPFAVIEILGIPEALPIGDFTAALKGEIIPSNTSYKNIAWSVIDADGTGAYFYGNVLTVNSKVIDPVHNIRAAATGGTVTVRATIKDGLLDEGDYTQDFKIAITKGVIAAGKYSAGGDGLAGDGWKACYWVNGQLFGLPTAYAVTSAVPRRYALSVTSGIVYVGDKQYIAGSYIRADNNFQSTLCYWVNGVEKPLPNSTGGNGDSYDYFPSRTCSLTIIADGGFVYILGIVDYNYYYWKIDANDDSATPVRVTLTLPAGVTTLYEMKNPISDVGYNQIAVKNGNVVVAARASNELGYYYWDSGNASTVGGVTSISPQKIEALVDPPGYVNNFPITCVASVNGEVYISGFCYNPASGNWSPYYYRMGDSTYNVIPLSGDRDNVYSIIEQNGSLWFYGGGRYWDVGGNINYLHSISYGYNTRRVVFSDGDVYVMINGDEIGGYMVVRKPFPFHSAQVDMPGEDIYVNLSGIVVR